tara:strand:+ start:803 stop:1045 length:243 start_codon:yes stop_codon:yes gene_type:complete
MDDLVQNIIDKRIAAQTPEIYGLACVLFKAAYEGNPRTDLDFTDPAPMYLRQAVILCGNKALRTEALEHLNTAAKFACPA